MSARHDDLKVDWRKSRPAMAVRRQPVKHANRVVAACRRIVAAVRAIPGGEPSNWRDLAVFFVGTLWGAMIAVGVLLAVAARLAP